MRVTSSITVRLAVPLAAAALTLAACASVPRPAEQLSRAHALVGQAEQSGGAQLAPDDYATARDKADQAERLADRQPQAARNLAEEAAADAEVSIARASQVKAEQAYREVESGNATLRTQVEHAAPTAPPPIAPEPPAAP
jgi:hypothetical protein